MRLTYCGMLLLVENAGCDKMSTCYGGYTWYELSGDMEARVQGVLEPTDTTISCG
jgi:hypothetical protein